GPGVQRPSANRAPPPVGRWDPETHGRSGSLQGSSPSRVRCPPFFPSCTVEFAAVSLAVFTLSCTRSDMASANGSHFFCLPLELREEIYRFALADRSNNLTRRSRRAAPPSRDTKAAVAVEVNEVDSGSSTPGGIIAGAIEYMDPVGERGPVEMEDEEEEQTTVTPNGSDDIRKCANVALLSVCRQIHVEATPTFYSHNTLDVVVDGEVPYLHVHASECDAEWHRYADGSEEDGSLAATELHRDLCRHAQPLQQVPAAHLRRVRAWRLVFPTHRGGHLGGQRRAEARAWDQFRARLPEHSLMADGFLQGLFAHAYHAQRCADMSAARAAHRARVAQGLDAFLRAVGGSERSKPDCLGALELVFPAYYGTDGGERGADSKLARRVYQGLPREWLDCLVGVKGGVLWDEISSGIGIDG
ncbi:hypothetical protein BDY21DRAFT_398666, partial [Lineolata rhizophorae]